jgi:hypothetical protein
MDICLQWYNPGKSRAIPTRHNGMGWTAGTDVCAMAQPRYNPGLSLYGTVGWDGQ